MDSDIAANAAAKYLELDDNRDNRRVAARTLKEIEGEVASGKLDYAARFPESPRLAHFGLTPQPISTSNQEEKATDAAARRVR